MAAKNNKATDNPDAGQDAAEQPDAGPYAEVKRRLNLYRLGAAAGMVVCALLFGVSVFVVMYSGLTSMTAFKELPEYRVNSLVLKYRDAVDRFDQSMSETQAKLDSEPAQSTLRRARALSQQVLQSEQAFDQILSDYSEAMAAAAEQVGGALEWNRYFQADMQSLRDNSSERQSRLHAMLDQFPAPKLPPSDAPAEDVDPDAEADKNQAEPAPQ